MNILSRRTFFHVVSCGFLFLVMAPHMGFAQVSEIESLKALVRDMQQQLQKALSRIEDLEKEKVADSVKLNQVEKSVKAVQSAPSILNPAIGMAIDGVVQQQEKVGGNFNFRAAELGISASIDPYARAYAFFTGSNEGVEVEEAAIVTTSLPWNLQARAGRFFADFGRFPKYHVHELPFVNEPLSIERIVGGESQADGVELSYLFPTPFFLRGTVGGYNKIGADNERVDNNRSRAWSRFTYLGRLHTYFDLGTNHSIEFGTSLAYTPSVRLQSDPVGGSRTMTGVDLTFRYQPLASTLYQGLTFAGEYFGNSERFERESGVRRMFAPGGYAYVEAKLSREWAAGFLFDNAPSLTSPGKKTNSYSPFVTWNLSEFNRLRFQYSYFDDKVREEKSEQGNQFFLQWTTVLGSHTHGFRTRY
jgi:hypothetical protein